MTMTRKGIQLIILKRKLAQWVEQAGGKINNWAKIIFHPLTKETI